MLIKLTIFIVNANVTSIVNKYWPMGCHGRCQQIAVEDYARETAITDALFSLKNGLRCT